MWGNLIGAGVGLAVINFFYLKVEIVWKYLSESTLILALFYLHLAGTGDVSHKIE